MALLASLPWYWRLIQRIELTFDSLAARYAATVAAAAVFVTVVAVLYYGGRRLKRRYDGDTVELLQSLVVTAMAIGITGFLIAVWRISNDVFEALGFLSVTPEGGVKLLVTFIALAGGLTVTRLTKRSVKYGSGRVEITPHQREVAHHAIQIMVFIPVVGFVVALWGIPVTNIFLGAGVLGIIFGFAARKTLSGILSGFVILFARPFEVGDWIRVADREGIVTDITIYNTQVRTFNEEHVLVPNDTVTESEIINYSKTDQLRLETDIGIDYETDIATAARVGIRAMEQVDSVAEQPPPDVIRREFADSAVVLRLRYWITTSRVQRKWRAQNAVIESVKRAFESEGIKIPFPQRELTDRKDADRVNSSDGKKEGEHTAARRSGSDGGPTDSADRVRADDVEESVTEPSAEEDAFR